MALARLTLSYEENTWHMITSYYWWGNTRMPKAQCALQLARAACDSLINLMHFVGILTATRILNIDTKIVLKIVRLSASATLA